MRYELSEPVECKYRSDAWDVILVTSLLVHTELYAQHGHAESTNPSPTRLSSFQTVSMLALELHSLYFSQSNLISVLSCSENRSRASRHVVLLLSGVVSPSLTSPNIWPMSKKEAQAHTHTHTNMHTKTCTRYTERHTDPNTGTQYSTFIRTAHCFLFK